MVTSIYFDLKGRYRDVRLKLDTYTLRVAIYLPRIRHHTLNYLTFLTKLILVIYL